MIAFHAHDKKGGGARVLCVHRLEWTAEGKPVLAGKAAHFGVRLTMGQEGQIDQGKDKTPPPPTLPSSPANPTAPTGKTKEKRMSKIVQWIKDY